MLEVDLDKRPDIFQVSYFAFTISGKTSPVKNLHVRSIIIILKMNFQIIIHKKFYFNFQKSPVPNIEELIITFANDKRPITNTQSATKLLPTKSQLSNVAPVESFYKTSVTPRQRPKPINSNISVTSVGSSPVLKRALFSNAVQPQILQPSDVGDSFPKTVVSSDNIDGRFPSSSGSPSVEENTFNNLFPSNAGMYYKYY